MPLENAPANIQSVSDAEILISRDDADKVQSNLDFYYGNHWQDGGGWRGSMPSTTTLEGATIAAEIERGFVSKNTIKEVVDRAVNGVVGRDPGFTLSYSVEGDKRKQKPILKEAEAVLKRWMKDKDFKKFVQKALRNALLSGKSTLRILIPPGLINEGGVEVNPDNPLQLVYLDAPSPLAGSVLTDENTRESMSIFLGVTTDTDGREKKFADLSYLLPVENVDGKRITEIAILPERGIAEYAQLDLNGKLMMFELEMPRLISEQIRSLQMLQNLNLSMMLRNSNLGGFLERIVLNGQLPGHYEDDGNGGQVWVRDEFAVGAGTVNAINGVPVMDENGNVRSYTSASVAYRDPISVSTFLESKDAAYRGILEESQQLHALLSGDAITSGDSRRQALAAFMSSLRIPKQQAESAIEWLVEVILMCAGTLGGDPDKYRGIVAKAECKLDFGAISAGEIDLLERQVRIGIISVETARERIGIENLEEEAQRVRDGLDVVMRAAKLFGSNATLDSGQDNRDTLSQDDTGEQ